ncbi:MAG TPA: sensor histidine kinase [Polyangiaceae bacterium]|nr:sensor histidine kinase [Polyangiaceae bacterium]
MTPRSAKPTAPGGAAPRAVTLAAAHARLAQWTLTVYAATALVVATLLLATLLTEKTHSEEQLEGNLRTAVTDRSHALRRYLDLLSAELVRLGSRSEIESADHDDAPERRLLELAHKKSTLFDVGVAILDRDGNLIWCEPHNFLPENASFHSAPWFSKAVASEEVQVVPVAPERKDALIYVVAPAMHDERLGGVVLGAIDLSRRSLGTLRSTPPLTTAFVLTHEGAVVYPADARGLSTNPALMTWLTKPREHAESMHLELGGEAMVVASAPLVGTELSYALLTPESVLFAKTRHRLYLRASVGLVLVVAPFVMLVLLLRRALKIFRRSEQEAVERERLELLGEASNLIAHEVRNALNGLRVGLDLVLKPDARGGGAHERIVRQLRDEMQRLADFTSELMLFSKGIVVHPVHLDLAESVVKFSELSLDLAAEAGCRLEVKVERAPLMAKVDPALLRVVVGNLIGNALDALSSADAPREGEVSVVLDSEPGLARLRVMDNGPGVPVPVRSKLFQPFSTTKPSGTGLGLFLSRRIAQAHGGDLVLQDSAKGAAFLLTLPAEVS